MLVYPEWLLVARCPSCLGQFIYRPLSAFEINSREKKAVSCYGGIEVFSCWLVGKTQLRIEIKGPCCEDAHVFSYRLSELNSPLAIELTCADTGINLGYLGNAKAVVQAVSADFFDMVEYCGEALNVFWRRPALVEKIFCRINTLYAEHNVVCKKCGSRNIDIETVYGNNLLLVCSDCQTTGALYADRELNWHIVKGAEAVFINGDAAKIRLGAENIQKSKK